MDKVQQKQIEQQQSTITKLKRENDSNTASILRLVAYLENVGGLILWKKLHA